MTHQHVMAFLPPARLSNTLHIQATQTIFQLIIKNFETPDTSARVTVYIVVTTVFAQCALWTADWYGGRWIKR